MSGLSSGSLRIEVSTSDTFSDSIAAEILSMTLFDLGAQAVGEELAAGRVSLLAGFETVDLAEQARIELMGQHEKLVSSAVVDEVSADAWVNTQKEGIEPTQIGSWHIRGPWHPKPDSGRIDPFHDIVIDPGAAFGHGAHPTTQLTVELMLGHLRPENARTTTVVDLGTGTGVAAIIAARLGATVRAIEIDQDACEVAQHNIAQNSIAPFDETTGRIELINSDAADAHVESGDLVLANVTLDIQQRIATRASLGHRVVTSGFLARQVRAMQDLYPGHSPSTIRSSGDWNAIDFLID